MLDDWSVQTASTLFNIFGNKGNVVWMLNESLNRFKFDSTRFQQSFNVFPLLTVLDDLFKYPHHLFQQSVERMLNQMLKPFELAFNVVFQAEIITCIMYFPGSIPYMKISPFKVL